MMFLATFFVFSVPVIAEQSEHIALVNISPPLLVFFYPIAHVAHTCAVYLTILVSVHRYLGICHPFMVSFTQYKFHGTNIHRENSRLMRVYFESLLLSLQNSWMVKKITPYLIMSEAVLESSKDRFLITKLFNWSSKEGRCTNETSEAHLEVLHSKESNGSRGKINVTQKLFQNSKFRLLSLSKSV